MFSPVAFALCLYHWMVLSSPVQNTLNVTTKLDHHHQFSIDELLTTNFPKKVSNDSGLNPCKASECLVVFGPFLKLNWVI